MAKHKKELVKFEVRATLVLEVSGKVKRPWERVALSWFELVEGLKKILNNKKYRLIEVENLQVTTQK